MKQSQAKERADIEREVTEIKKQKGKYVGDARSDPDVQELDQELKSDGWIPDDGGATVIRVDNPDKDSELPHDRYHVVIIPYRKPGSSIDARLLWTSKSLESVGLASPIVHKIGKEEDENKETQADSRLGSGTGEPEEQYIETYSVGEAGVNRQTEMIRTDFDNKQTGFLSISSDSCFCETTIYECEDIGLWCYVSLAAAYAGTYWACGVCATGVGWITCGKCAVAVIGSGAGTVSCIESADCWYEDVCRSESEVRQEPCKVCDNIHYPNCGA